MWALLSAVEALFWAVFSALSVGLLKIERFRFFFNAALVSLLWVGLEQLRGSIPFGGLPWGFIAYPLVDSPLRFWAPFGGEVAIGFIACFSALLVYKALTAVARKRFSVGFALVLAATLVCHSGFFLPISAPSNELLTVALVQGNVEEPVKETFAQSRRVLNNHVVKTRELLDAVRAGKVTKPQVIFWGENALDLDPFTDFKTRQAVSNLARSQQIPIIAGQISQTPRGLENQVMVWVHTGRLGNSYSKQHPVPFGEFFPRSIDFWPFNSLLGANAGEVVAGSEPALLEAPLSNDEKVLLAPGICFEAAFQSVFREPVLDGAKLLAVPTNNSSFGHSAQSLQQLQMVRLRALEFDRSALQISTNGVSAMVTRNGEVVAQTELFTADFAVSELELRTNITFTARHGALLHSLTLGFVGLVLLVAFTRFLAQRRNLA